MLYGASCRIAKEMGYKKAVTYILASENGASLKASGFTCDGTAGKPEWTGKRGTGKDVPHEMKTRWFKDLVCVQNSKKSAAESKKETNGIHND
jgi:hypothetical protein